MPAIPIGRLISRFDQSTASTIYIVTAGGGRESGLGELSLDAVRRGCTAYLWLCRVPTVERQKPEKIAAVVRAYEYERVTVDFKVSISFLT